jgi:pyrroloquinoline quinone biosynthesis protein B
MRAIILGAGAGGGVPQWNCACQICRRARADDPAVPPRTQASLAVSADDRSWLILNAAPDLRQQIQATPALHPREGARDSPIGAVLVTNGDVDAIGGLLTLREGQPFALYAGDDVHAILDANPVFDVVNRSIVARRHLSLDVPTTIADAGGAPLGLEVTAFAVPGKVPLYMEGDGADPANDGGVNVAVRVRQPDTGASLVHMPACAAITDAVRARLEGADAAFVDGTLYRDDELIAAGLGAKTGKRMGHVSMAEPDGPIARLADLAIGRRIFVHINNSNPALAADSPEHAEVAAAGWTVGTDGLEVVL